MINERLKKRLKKDRPSTTITMRIPTDVVESLKAVAPMRGFTAYQTLLKSYISEGLRRDEPLGPVLRLGVADRKIACWQTPNNELQSNPVARLGTGLATRAEGPRKQLPEVRTKLKWRRGWQSHRPITICFYLHCR
jgi:hypothetical protein